jgi:hypothetical protein
VFNKEILRKTFGLKREKVSGGSKKLCNKQVYFYKLCFPPNNIRAIKSRKMMWAAHVTCTGENRSSCRMLVVKPKGKRPLRSSRDRWEDSIKI